jgi:transposase-like protein
MNLNDIQKALSDTNGDLKAAAKQLDCKYQTLYYWVKTNNLVYENKKAPLNIEMVERLYRQLGSLSAVAKEIGCTKEGVRLVMKRNGFDIKRQIIYNANYNLFKEENEQSLYWAGFIAADGCVKQRKTNCSDRFELQIALSSKDHKHLEKFKNDIQYDGPIRKSISKNSKINPLWNDTESCEIQITSKEIFDDLSKYNIVPRKSLIYTFPEWLITHPLINHFMRGYFDGDGSWYLQKYLQKKQQLMFSLRGTPEFLTTYRTILERECGLQRRDKLIRINSGIGVLEYGGNGITSKIASFLYKDASIYLDRKYNMVKLNND